MPAVTRNMWTSRSFGSEYSQLRFSSLMSLKNPGSRRTSCMEKGSAFHGTLANFECASSWTAVSFPVLCAAFTPLSSAAAVEGRSAAVPSMAAPPRNPLRVTFCFIGSTPHFSGAAAGPQFYIIEEYKIAYNQFRSNLPELSNLLLIGRHNAKLVDAAGKNRLQEKRATTSNFLAPRVCRIAASLCLPPGETVLPLAVMPASFLPSGARKLI